MVSIGFLCKTALSLPVALGPLGPSAADSLVFCLYSVHFRHDLLLNTWHVRKPPEGSSDLSASTPGSS